MKKFAVLVAVIAMAMAMVPMTGAFAKPHAKATGGVTWTSGGGLEGIHTSFNAHDDAPGAQPDRGNLVTKLPDGSMIRVDISCVLVVDNEAWFAGEVVKATGTQAGREGEGHVTRVEDNGTPGRNGDRIGGTYQPTEAAACALLGTFSGSGTVTGGNLKVHNR